MSGYILEFSACPPWLPSCGNTDIGASVDYRALVLLTDKDGALYGAFVKQKYHTKHFANMFLAALFMLG